MDNSDVLWAEFLNEANQSGLMSSLGSREIFEIINPKNHKKPAAPVDQAFQGGKLLDNKKGWLEGINFVQGKGGEVPPFLRRAVDRGSFDLFDKEYFDWARKDICFLGKKYSSWDALKAEKIPNHKGATTFEDEIECKVKEYLASGLIRKVSEDQAKRDRAIFSPINMSTNGRFIFHWRFKGVYPL